MDLVKLGLADKQIAYQLGIGSLTVSNNLSNGVFSKLGAHNRAHAVYEELLDFLLFILPHIRSSPGTPQVPGLILPGQPGYTVPPDAIKREIRKHG